MGKRKIFTKKEYAKLSKTHEGRLKIYSKYCTCAVLSCLGFIALCIVGFCINELQPLGFIGLIGILVSAIFIAIFAIGYKKENKTYEQKLRQKEIISPEVATAEEFSAVQAESENYDENSFYPTPVPISTSYPSPNDTYKVTAETKEVPEYILEQQQALAYIEANEGIETNEGEHYYKLAMSYFTLQKACYRPMLIKNLEKYLTAKPYTAKYKEYAIDELYCGFYPRPARKNNYELAERNFLRHIYYFLGRAYEQEGDGRKAIYYLDLGMGIIPEGAELFLIELFFACKKANDLPLFLKYCDQLPQTDHVEEYRRKAQNLIEKGYVYKSKKKKETTKQN